MNQILELENELLRKQIKELKQQIMNIVTGKQPRPLIS